MKGTPVYITDNMNKDIGLVNGTKAFFHFLTPCNKDQALELKNCGNELLVTLSLPPKTANVELPSPYNPSKSHEKDKHDQWVVQYSNITLVPGKVVLPILPKRFKHNAWVRTTTPSKVHTKQHFPLMLGFAITIFKAQGMTLDKIILAIGQRPMALTNFEYNTLYVAFSREKEASNIRILLPDGMNWSSVAYISNLKPDPTIHCYFEGYNTHRDWSSKHALHSYNRCGTNSSKRVHPSSSFPLL